MLLSLVHWLEENMLACSYVKYLGVECPGCGMQRGFLLLLKGEFVDSFKMFPALGTIIIMLIYLIAHIIFKFNRGATVIQYLFVINVTIIVTNFILKQL